MFRFLSRPRRGLTPPYRVGSKCPQRANPSTRLCCCFFMMMTKSQRQDKVLPRLWRWKPSAMIRKLRMRNYVCCQEVSGQTEVIKLINSICLSKVQVQRFISNMSETIASYEHQWSFCWPLFGPFHIDTSSFSQILRSVKAHLNASLESPVRLGTCECTTGFWRGPATGIGPVEGNSGAVRWQVQWTVVFCWTGKRNLTALHFCLHFVNTKVALWIFFRGFRCAYSVVLGAVIW